jgi:hypothetical protein
MAEARRATSFPPVVAFLLGALVVAAVAVGYILFTRATHEPVEVKGVEIEAPKLPGIDMPDAPKLPRGVDGGR